MRPWGFVSCCKGGTFFAIVVATKAEAALVLTNLREQGYRRGRVLTGVPKGSTRADRKTHPSFYVEV